MEKYSRNQHYHQVLPSRCQTSHTHTNSQPGFHKAKFILPLIRSKSDQRIDDEQEEGTAQTVICTRTPPKTAEQQISLAGTNLLTPDMILGLRKEYMSHKLRKLMAVEIVKSQSYRVKGDLKRIVKQMNSQVHSNSQEFIILGGGTKSLSYFKSPSGGGGFTLEIDVRGYVPANISVDTSNNQMTIRAIKVNGRREKALSLLAPSTQALEKVKIFPPQNGFLLLKYPNNES